MVVVSGAPAGAAGTPPLYSLKLPQGQSAVVFNTGVAQIFNKDHTKVETRLFPTSLAGDKGAATIGLPDKAHLLADLAIGPKTPFPSDTVIVVLRPGISASQDLQVIDRATLLQVRTSVARHQLGPVPQYTSDVATNRVLTTLGVDRTERLFRQFNRSTLSGMVSRMQSSAGHQALDFSNAYRLHITGTSVRSAVEALSRLPSVEYASPDWHVEPMNTPPIPVPQSALQSARQVTPALHSAIASSSVPTNFVVQSSAQSMLNASSDNAIAAFDEIQQRTHQLPGQGETITNVSLGDLDDASAAANPKDRCNFYASAYGPTTEVLGGQRYLNLPSMPLIPTYTADSNGNLSGSAEVCGVDPFITEIGLDFSMMAPLPHSVQRPGEQGSGLTDLLGVAPGANYRLVVPASSSPTNSDIDAAFLGAAMQMPRANVITASLGFGYDVYGFPSRYLEDDPLTEAIIASIVQSYNIVVCVSSGDGTRTYTTVAIGPRGGSAATNSVPPGGNPTKLNDVGFSTVPSEDSDSGSIDVGGTTLDDIFAAPPQNPQFASLRNNHAFAETRWTGFTNFSSGFGTRVNVSAPSDNVLSLAHHFGGPADAVDVLIEGGTSASAPQTAAAAAVLLQVGQLVRHPLRTPGDVRNFLAAHGTVVPPVSQADKNLQVGPQIDLAAAVEALGALGGAPLKPSVARVAVEQRRHAGNYDGVFLSATDPTNIDLTNRNSQAWITLAPDWEALPQGATFALHVVGKAARALSTTRFARLLPDEILTAAGLPFVSASNRTAKLEYVASLGGKTIASTTFSLTFGPTDGKSDEPLAPDVPSVVTGSTIPVRYDLTHAVISAAPSIIVSHPGRLDPATGQLFHPVYTAPLPAGLRGTINVPVAALQGGGIYGISIAFGPTTFLPYTPTPFLSDFAFTRVAPAPADRPMAPTLSSNGSPPGHFLEVPYNGTFQLNYNVGNVAGATGALLEVSAAGPTDTNIYNPFNNPNGSIRDHNGVDSGSLYTAPLSGTSGTITLEGLRSNLIPTLNEVVRIIPMKFGAPAGEASDVSTVTMDGVFASDGGYVNNGYGINQSGNDGFITSDQITATGEELGSLETFDQRSNGIVAAVQSRAGNGYFTTGWGIFGNDLGLFGDSTATTTTYNTLSPTATGTVGSAWTPPSPTTLFINEAAAQQANDIGAFFAYDTIGTQNDNFRVFTSHIPANTFSRPYDVSGPVKTFGSPVVFAFGENTATNTGVLAASDFAGNCPPPTIITVGLGGAAEGKVDSFTGVGAGFPYGMGVDSVTNKAAVPTLCDGGFGIYNLATKSATNTILPGKFSGFYTAADQSAHQFAVEQTTSADFPTNNNALSSVLVLDESGNIVKSMERFNLYNTFLTVNANNLQLNPARRSGYIFGPLAQQLEPFTY
ncbi:MAG: S8 family serine peptidase [Candidatus Eremiobacteraeota bacterium]|nr:S8 family serine peptidase [Candidatus Eremiobacteraeota bacterium]